MTGRNLYSKNKRLLSWISSAWRILPYKIRIFFLHISLLGGGGKVMAAIRFTLLRTLCQFCGDNVLLKEHCYVYHPDQLKIGNNVSIHPMCYIDALGGISIGDNVSIAHGTSIISFNHTWEDSNTPIKYNPLNCKPITINSDVWIGCGCRILAGVCIGKRSIIGAGAVVVKDVPPYTIVAGNPARVIKTLTP